MPRNTQDMPIFRSISSAKRTGENGSLSARLYLSLWTQAATRLSSQKARSSRALQTQDGGDVEEEAPSCYENELTFIMAPEYEGTFPDSIGS